MWSSELICGTVCSLMEQSAHLWSCSPVVVAYFEHVDETQVVVCHCILFVQFEHRLKVRNRVFVSKQSKHRHTERNSLGDHPSTERERDSDSDRDRDRESETEREMAGFSRTHNLSNANYKITCQCHCCFIMTMSDNRAAPVSSNFCS